MIRNRKLVTPLKPQVRWCVSVSRRLWSFYEKGHFVEKLICQGEFSTFFLFDFSVQKIRNTKMKPQVRGGVRCFVRLTCRTLVEKLCGEDGGIVIVDILCRNCVDVVRIIC